MAHWLAQWWQVRWQERDVVHLVDQENRSANSGMHLQIDFLCHCPPRITWYRGLVSADWLQWYAMRHIYSSHEVRLCVPRINQSSESCVKITAALVDISNGLIIIQKSLLPYTTVKAHIYISNQSVVLSYVCRQLNRDICQERPSVPCDPAIHAYCC